MAAPKIRLKYFDFIRLPPIAYHRNDRAASLRGKLVREIACLFIKL